MRIDDGHCIRGHIRHIEPAAVGIHCQSNRLRAEITLPRQARVEVAPQLKLARAHIDGGHGIAIGERDIERLLAGRKKQTRMGAFPEQWGWAA